MAKKKSITHTTVTLSVDLRRRMSKVKEPVNWSALARDAFEAKLTEIAKNKENKTMSDVLQRLRGSKKALETGRYKIGVEWGESWVKHHADAEELQRIERECDRNQGDWEGCTGAEFESIVDPDAHYYGGGGYGFSGGFWFTWFRDDQGAVDVDLINDPEFVRGFVDAALEVWAQV